MTAPRGLNQPLGASRLIAAPSAHALVLTSRVFLSRALRRGRPTGVGRTWHSPSWSFLGPSTHAAVAATISHQDSYLGPSTCVADLRLPPTSSCRNCLIRLRCVLGFSQPLDASFRHLPSQPCFMPVTSMGFALRRLLPTRSPGSLSARGVLHAFASPPRGGAGFEDLQHRADAFTSSCLLRHTLAGVTTAAPSLVVPPFEVSTRTASLHASAELLSWALVAIPTHSPRPRHRCRSHGSVPKSHVLFRVS